MFLFFDRRTFGISRGNTLYVHTRTTFHEEINNVGLYYRLVIQLNEDGETLILKISTK